MTYEDKIKSIAQEVESIFAYDGEVNPDLVIDIFYEKLLDNVELKMSYEKQVPKKPVIPEYRNFYQDGVCPICVYLLQRYEEDDWGNTTGNKYCGGCGQAIDWSDVE